MTIRVLHITRDVPPRDNGGISTAVRLLTDATAAHANCGHAFVSFDGWRPRQNTGANDLDEVTESGIRLSHPGQLDAARAWCLTNAFDVLHVHDPLLWDFAMQVREQSPAPVVYTAHTVQDAANRVRKIERVTRSAAEEARALREADRVHVASDFALDLLTRQGVDHSRIWKIRWPLPPQRDPVDPEQASVARTSQGLPARDPETREPAVILSRFGYLKGTDRAFDMLLSWFRADPHARCDWIGGLPDSPKRERRWIRRWQTLAGDRQGRLRFTGWKPRSEAMAALTPGRVVLCTSRHESFGLGVAEAMAAGCVVVSTRCGGPCELIEDEKTGFLLKDDLTGSHTFNRLNELAQSIEDRARIGEAARRRIRALCEPAELSAQYEKLYRGERLDGIGTLTL